MKVLGFDLETTGLDTQKDLITEIGAVVWDVERKQPVEMMSKLVSWYFDLGIKPDISEEITSITGITCDDISSHGMEGSIALEMLDDLAGYCEYTVAHNGLMFDQPFLLSMADRAGLKLDNIEMLLMIDTRLDLPLPPAMKNKPQNLTMLAALHEFINPFPHRAVTDVLTMMKVFSKYDINYMTDRASYPIVEVVAKVPFKEKHLIDGKGFKFQKEPDRTWHKILRECDFNDERADWLFDYNINEFGGEDDGNNNVGTSDSDPSGSGRSVSDPDQLLLEIGENELGGTASVGNSNEVSLT